MEVGGGLEEEAAVWHAVSVGTRLVWAALVSSKSVASAAEPLRILHVAPYAPAAWAYGGIPRVVGALTTGLARRGHQVTLVATDAGDRNAPLALSARELNRQPRFAAAAGELDLRLFRNLSNRLAYDLQLFLPRGLGRFLAANAGRFDVAHLHAFRNLPVARAARALGRADVPFVITPNGTAPRIESRRLAKAIWDLAFGRAPLERAARLLAVSEHERRELVASGLDPRRIERVPNPLDLGEFEPPPDGADFRRRHGLEGARIVLYLGRISPRKRLDLLIEAFSRLAPERPDLRLVIAGNEMSHADALARLIASSGFAERTRTLGLLVGGARLEALAAADAVAYAAEAEIFGLVPFEALLAGTPVVVADDSGCGELVAATGGGRIVPAGDVAALAAALAELVDPPQAVRAELAAAAREVRRRFGADTVCARLESIYLELVRRS